MRMLLIAALALCGLYLAAAGAMFAFQRQLQYFPSHRAPTPAEAGFEGATEVALTGADGTKILLWYAAAPPGAATVLYFQGKGGEIADRPKRWASYRAAGLGVAYLSYRGYGASEGSPTEAGLHMDADAAYEWLIAQSVTPDSIAVVGESLGTGVAAQLAADLPIGALILEAPYTSVAEVAAARFPWLPVRWLILDPFRPTDVINRVTCPLYWSDWGWEKPEKRLTYIALAQWAKLNGFYTRGHCLIWPGWRWLPKRVEALKADPAALRKAIDDYKASYPQTA